MRFDVSPGEGRPRENDEVHDTEWDTYQGPRIPSPQTLNLKT